MPEIVLHALAPSHPCMTVDTALRLKGLEFERIDLTPGPHVEEMQAIYGEGNHTVPGITVDGDPVHGSRAILERLERISSEPPLYPEPGAEAVREAERWGDDELQDLGRSLAWGAMHFRPESMGTFGGAAPLDPAGTDYAMKFIHASWKYHRISATRLADDLAGLPAKLDHVDDLAAAGIIGGEAPNAADLQIGATLRVLLTIGDLEPLVETSVGAEIARRWFPDYAGHVPAGAFPAGWVPDRSG